VRQDEEGSAMSGKRIGFASSIGFGGSTVGTLYRPMSDQQAEEALQAAYDAGLRYFDTAPLYGYGLSELRFGRFLRSVPRDSFTLSTKVGRYLVPPRGEAVDQGIWANALPLKPVFDYSYDGTMRGFEQSASRFGFAGFDILYIHDADRFNHGAEYDRIFGQAMDGCYRALDELRSAGDIRAIGVGVNESDVATRFLRAGDFDAIMIAGRYTLLQQDALTDLVPEATAKGVELVAVGIFNSGILAASAVDAAAATYNYGPVPTEIAEKARKLRAVCDAHGVPLQAAAIQFPLRQPAISAVVIGMGSPKEVAQNNEWAKWPIPPALWSDLRSAGLLRADAP
jgi:D-threo-aldose 1-dehydrogenase